MRSLISVNDDTWTCSGRAGLLSEGPKGYETVALHPQNHAPLIGSIEMSLLYENNILFC